ncbi:MAG: prephenate dehydratase [Chloroflexaceae bacterium]|nr:prephenate dehydratase [Chloroflexaceae bacterium]
MIVIAYLGPAGTNAETAALAYLSWLAQHHSQEAHLCSYPSIARAMRAVVQQEATLAVVPIENSIQGSVAVTLDNLWQLGKLQIQQELVLPIAHALLSRGETLAGIKTVYSHPQALAQCQLWLETHLPNALLVPSNSTTEALQHLNGPSAAAIAAPRAAQLYNLPILASSINDYADNCTRFWVLGTQASTDGTHLSLAFDVPANRPGSLVNPLQSFAQRQINLTRIESRPARRSLGEYLFFVELEGSLQGAATQAALTELAAHTQNLKSLVIIGFYPFTSTPSAKIHLLC